MSYLGSSGICAGLALCCLFMASDARADTQTLQCTNNSQPWATLTLDTEANTASLLLNDPNSVGPGNVSGSGTYPAQITDDQGSWTLSFSATYYNYTLDRAAGLLRQQVYDNDTGELLGDSDNIACS